MGFLHLSVHFLEFGLLLIKKEQKEKIHSKFKRLCVFARCVVTFCMSGITNNLNRVARLPHIVASCVVSGTHALLLKGPEMRRLVITLQCGILVGKAPSQRLTSATQ